jgi:uncharacterized Zn finger protein (UPF0148 family)
MVTIVCSRCGREAAVKRTSAKFCPSCRTEVRREVKARSDRKNAGRVRASTKKWRAENRERVRELERRRVRPNRTEYKREWRLRKIAVFVAPRWAAAAVEVERTWLALPAGPTAEEKADPCRPLVCQATRTFVAGLCAECGEAFAYCHVGGPIHRFCKPLCGKRHERRQYRGRQRSAFVEPVFRRKIFARDGWRCQICGKRVVKSAVVPHPKAATVDHIVPLADGGEHSMANAQTAHFICNSEKSAGARNDQLRLVG